MEDRLVRSTAVQVFGKARAALAELRSSFELHGRE